MEPLQPEPSQADTPSTPAQAAPEPHSAFNGTRGARRAAALLVALGAEISSEVIKRLPEEDVGKLTWEIVGIPELSPAERDEVLRDFYASATGHKYATIGGIEYAEQALDAAFGVGESARFLEGLHQHAGPRPFAFLEHIPPEQLVSVLQDEHPQVIAMILLLFGIPRAMSVLKALPIETTVDVCTHIGQMDLRNVSPEMIRGVEDIVFRRTGGESGRGGVTEVGGADALVSMLRSADVATEKSVMEGVQRINPEIAAELRQKMFTFEDLVLLDARSMQRVLREFEGRDLALALKAAPPAVMEHVSGNLSTRAQAMLKDDIEALGPVRRTQVEEARGRIVQIVRKLEETEEILVMRGGADELVV